MEDNCNSEPRIVFVVSAMKIVSQARVVLLPGLFVNAQVLEVHLEFQENFNSRRGSVSSSRVALGPQVQATL